MMDPTTATRTALADDSVDHDGVEILAAFARAVRSGGVPVTAHRSGAFLQACSILDVGWGAGVYWAGRSTLCSCLDDVERYDQVYAAWFGGEPLGSKRDRPSVRTPTQAILGGDTTDSEEHGANVAIHAAASTLEVLRNRDIAELSPAERAALAGLFGILRPRPPLRSSARRRPARRGEVDARRTLRAELRNAGEPARLLHRDRTTRPRRVVLLIDVSGSMAPYADSLLRFAHVVTTANRNRTETFTIGTRLTRVTRAMRLRDSDAALKAAGAAVPDWSGGTRLGETLHVFLERWGRRGIARGAVVLVMSDGWERGDAELLGEQMRHVHRLAHKVIWANPHRGRQGYAPVQAGIAAALPHIDALIAGHSMTAFEQALEAVSHA